MTDFKDIFREERHFCNHLFRLLCYSKEDGGKDSGLGQFLTLTDLPIDLSVNTISGAEVYTEVAVFRDFYYYHPSREDFLLELYDRFLPMMQKQYRGKIATPTPLRDLLPELQGVHPRLFSRRVGPREENRLFYREFSALFSAKPDFLVICDGLMIWLEVKFWTAFSRAQLRRTENIANLCSSALFAPVFGSKPNRLVMLGTRRHVHAPKWGDFIYWADVARIAEELLPHGADNYTAQALKALTVLDTRKAKPPSGV